MSLAMPYKATIIGNKYQFVYTWEVETDNWKIVSKTHYPCLRDAVSSMNRTVHAIWGNHKISYEEVY